MQKITLPTGGCKIFNFESNTYSHIGPTELQDFSENPNNGNPHQRTITLTNAFTTTETLVLTEGTYACLSHAVSYSAGQWFLSLYEQGSTTPFPGAGFHNDHHTPNLHNKYIWLPAGTYTVKFNPVSFPVPPHYTASITIDYKTPEIKERFLYGGGLRIKTIGLFDQDVQQNYYELTHSLIRPVKEIHYDYSSFDDTSMSSGSLVFAKPVYEYNRLHATFVECTNSVGVETPTSFDVLIEYKSFTEFNNLLALRTHGSDVGYKNVTVTETDNGKTEYTYTSPIDQPETSYRLVEVYYNFNKWPNQRRDLNWEVERNSITDTDDLP